MKLKKRKKDKEIMKIIEDYISSLNNKSILDLRLGKDYDIKIKKIETGILLMILILDWKKFWLNTKLVEELCLLIKKDLKSLLSKYNVYVLSFIDEIYIEWI